MFKNALVSVSNKTGLVDLIKPLAQKGMRVVSTGGTAKLLRDNGVQVIEVAEQTGFPEVMDGRVRTLHPKIHMALLARQENSEDTKLLKDHNLESFDLVVGNLYPFEAQLNKNLPDRELAEFIDIGGPCLLRAAAKNYAQTTVLCDPEDYVPVLEKGKLSLEDRKSMAAKVFSHISSYDALIAQELCREEQVSSDFALSAELVMTLRYGENPVQKGFWLRTRGFRGQGLDKAKILNGKALSYNNLLDLDAAFAMACEFQQPAVVAVKHCNPCGVALGESLLPTLERALAADPLSVFGGIVALNRKVDEREAEKLVSIFIECVIAPAYTEKALEILKSKKNLRVMSLPFQKINNGLAVRSIYGGLLLQTNDQVAMDWQSNWKVIGEGFTHETQEDLLFAWKVCAHLKSNAIAVVKNRQTLGLGMGQVSRVEAVEQAFDRVKKHHSGQSELVLASDAFFPFPDSIEKAHENGVKWIIQPGGSIKDESVIETAQKLGVNLVLTGQRHFKH